jgi:hypothetical protein
MKKKKKRTIEVAKERCTSGSGMIPKSKKTRSEEARRMKKTDIKHNKARPTAAKSLDVSMKTVAASSLSKQLIPELNLKRPLTSSAVKNDIDSSATTKGSLFVESKEDREIHGHYRDHYHGRQQYLQQPSLSCIHLNAGLEKTRELNQQFFMYSPRFASATHIQVAND